ncbi:Glycyl-tRNA synthetase beta chain [hydrothermal vent metagenome]|uniref:glycine--tRNA ligase n=1 Tax=hydrothermal vent metagenome TaxID=652676 RepID=A0A3B0V6N4_9ZZZZ
MSELLFEIGIEEIPAGYIQPALQFLEQAACKQFEALGLRCGQVRTAGTPRRLTLAVADLQTRQPDRRVEHTGPAKKTGFDADGNPSRAALGFARSRGVAVEDLQVTATPKGEYLVAVEDIKGLETKALLPAILTGLIRDLPFPKSMRWGRGQISFARPILWLLALYGGEVVEFSIEETKSGAVTRGHRFMAPAEIAVTGFEDYLERLREHSVLADPVERRAAVIAEVSRAVSERVGGEGAEPVLDEKLVDLVTFLVEIPWGICGSFDEKFLELPEEVLITSMREHQKYFPVTDSDGKLLPLFVAVNNTRIADRELAANGHQRVLRARLEDGLFFFHQDRKKTLADRRQDLAGIIFQNKLGTVLEKSERIAALAAELARELEPRSEEDAVRAAGLAKCDLLTEMVGEFPSLQGVMGREYALIDGENEGVALAIREHYLPVRADGDLPATMVGAIVGIADRIDTLVGCFGIGERPTGTTDPFGLRRQALGLLHIIQGRDLSLSLRSLAGKALAGYGEAVAMAGDTVDQLLDFIRLRFENDLIAAGTRPDVIMAATAVAFDDVVECQARIRALDNIRGREQFPILAGSFKRIRNIIKDNRQTAVDENLLSHGAEKKLYSTLTAVADQAGPLLRNREYGRALEVMLQMKEPVDCFFDDVMVMVDDPAVRQNRLNLLTAFGDLVLQVGDISRMYQAA